MFVFLLDTHTHAHHSLTHLHWWAVESLTLTFMFVGENQRSYKPSQNKTMWDHQTVTFKQFTATIDEECLLLTTTGTKNVFSLSDKQMIMFWKKQFCSSDECLVYLRAKMAYRPHQTSCCFHVYLGQRPHHTYPVCLNIWCIYVTVRAEIELPFLSHLLHWFPDHWQQLCHSTHTHTLQLCDEGDVTDLMSGMLSRVQHRTGPRCNGSCSSHEAL